MSKRLTKDTFKSFERFYYGYAGNNLEMYIEGDVCIDCRNGHIIPNVKPGDTFFNAVVELQKYFSEY